VCPWSSRSHESPIRASQIEGVGAARFRPRPTPSIAAFCHAAYPRKIYLAKDAPSGVSPIQGAFTSRSDGRAAGTCPVFEDCRDSRKACRRAIANRARGNLISTCPTCSPQVARRVSASGRRAAFDTYRVASQESPTDLTSQFPRGVRR